MKLLKLILPISALVLAGGLGGCSNSSAKSPDVADAMRQSLKSAGLKDVTVSEDRDKGVVTLGGHVAADAEKAQAQSSAVSLAQGLVVANEIAVVAPGVESQAKLINSDVDKGIEKNLDAALVQNNLKKEVRYSVKNGVITLTGTVNSETRRSEAAQIASTVPYQQQIVNELQVKNQKATSN